MFEEVRGEKQLLSEEAEQLKLLLKREIEKLDGELKAKVILQCILHFKQLLSEEAEQLNSWTAN